MSTANILKILERASIRTIMVPLARQQPNQTADHIKPPSNASRSDENRTRIFPTGVTSKKVFIGAFITLFMIPV